MGTSNFYNKNASKVFAIEINDEFELACEYDSITAALKNNGWDTYKNINKAPYTGNSRVDRNYPGRILGSKTAGNFYGEAEVFITVTAVMRSGYYAGVNLDFNVEYHIDNFEMEPAPYGGFQYKGSNIKAEEILRRDYGMNAGLAKIQGSYVEYFFDRKQEDIVLELEGIYEEFSQPLKVAARFSNGETMYESA